MLIFNVPLIAFVVPAAEGAETRVSVDSLLFRLGPMLTATMFLLPVVIKVFGFTPYGRKKEKVLDVKLIILQLIVIKMDVTGLLF